jgi:two-component system chemotaxis sensor kinase CheA
MILFHTLNGGFGLYSLYPLQKIARENEFKINKLRENQNELSEYKVHFQQNVLDLESLWKKTIKEIDQVFRTNFSEKIATKEIVYKKVLEIKKLVDKTSNHELKELFYENLIFEPIENYFLPYDDLVKISAKSIKKNINKLTIKNGEILIDPTPYKEFFNVIVHLFRNCVDHGIESDKIRRSLGKTPEGYIGVIFNKITTDQASVLNIIIEDDGGGIDPKKIKSKLESLYPDQNFDQLSEHELIWKIFDPFFSTRDEVSALSGRGVGMSAIKEVVDALHGQIEIESTLGKGSKFIFNLPLQ